MVRLLLIGLALLGFATPAAAHRLDEYLQATTIALSRGHIDLRLTLTPSVNVAPQVLATIDRDGDGRLSASEQDAYARSVQADLDLTLDGAARPLRLISATFPPVEAMRHGVGDIMLMFDATAPPAGLHSLVLYHRHSGPDAVYLVNTLQPDDPAVEVLHQNRSYDQSRYQLDFAMDRPPSRSGNAAPAAPVARGNGWAVTVTYVWHGLRHILTGYDHLLFVAGLVLGAATLWDLVKVVTAFTVAHSTTLTLAALGLVHVPEALVEPFIAASIVAVAVQNIWRPDQARGASRLVMAFLFGLVHGLGFASGLLEIMHQMPTGTMLLAILGFSMGVEAGNQIVLLPLFGLTRWVEGRQSAAARGALFRRVASVGIALAGCVYLCLALGALTRG